MIEKYKYQKYYFQYMDDEYPNLTFNNIEYKLISDLSKNYQLHFKRL